MAEGSALVDVGDTCISLFPNGIIRPFTLPGGTIPLYTPATTTP